MSLVSPTMRDCVNGQQKGFSFWCPGCKGAHGVWVTPGAKPVWTWNGSVDKPTFSPSILVRSGHFVNPEHCWCKFNEKRIAEGKEPVSFKCRRCHSYVTDGNIQFLSDCTHILVGQTVALPEYPE